MHHVYDHWLQQQSENEYREALQNLWCEMMFHMVQSTYNGSDGEQCGTIQNTIKNRRVIRTQTQQSGWIKKDGQYQVLTRKQNVRKPLNTVGAGIH